MGIGIEELAKHLKEAHDTPESSDDGKDYWWNLARRLASRLDISPRREQNPLSAAEAARRGFNEGRG